MAVIGTLRQKLGGILIFVIALAMLAFIFMDMGGQGNSPTRGTDIAKVNGEAIPYTAFSERLEANETFMKNQLQTQNLTDGQMENLRTSTLNEMIEEKLKNGLYSNLGIFVGTEEKKAMLFDKQFQHPSITSSFTGQDGQYDPALFKQYLETLDLVDQNSGMTAEEKRAQWTNFEQAIYKERANNKYNQLLQASSNVPTWMAEVLYINENSTANIQYVYVPYNKVGNEEISFTDADLEAYLSTHQKDFEQEASVNIKYVAFPIQPSADDIGNAETWLSDKFTAWQEAENDSLFIMASSETRWDTRYYTQTSLANVFADSMFTSAIGSFFGPIQTGDQFNVYKLIDKKQIADSLKCRHLLITGEGYSSQEEVTAIIDSLRTAIIEDGTPLANLTAKYSQDPSNASKGGDLGWVSPDEMVAPFNNAIFFDMQPGDVKMVYTQFGAHFVEVYDWGTTQEAVKVASLTKSIFASEETSNGIFAEASLYSGNNRTKESFISASERVKDALNVAKTANTIVGLDGNAREMIKWAFETETGDVSAPFIIGDNFVVALQNGKSEEGKAVLSSVKALVEAEVVKEKKAELLIKRLSGSDLNALASNNTSSIKAENNISFNNVTLSGVGNEPKVVASALGLGVNELSSPIVGENGVFVVQTIAKTEASEATDLNAYRMRSSTYSTGVQSRLFEALKTLATVEDNSFDFF